VNVIDFGTSEAGEPYLVMEYLEGEDLERRILRAGSVPLKSAVQIARQVASALAVVHTKGIVHRDLKPANVFLIQLPGEPDFVKVLDFGVSKIKAASTRLTDASAVIGTPEYMSPEQASGMGGDIDHRADQWALACIVWEMLAGRSPFSADNIDAVFYQLLHLSPPPLSKYAPDLPPAVEPVLLRALSKGAEDRYPSAREFARALEAAALGNWSELTPMPFCPAALGMALREPAASADVGMDLAMTQVAAVEGGSDASADPTLKARRGSRLAATLAGLAIALCMAAAGLWFANARSTSPVAKADQQASVPKLEVAQVRPVAPSIAMEKTVRRNSTVARQSSLHRSSKARPAPHGTAADPFDRMLAPASADLPKKANPFASPSASRVRTPASSEVRPERRGVTRRDGKLHTFEAL
jgi:serine/threonine-protein kinase